MTTDESTGLAASSTREPSTFVISLTPFDSSQRFDEDAFREHLRRLASSGIGVYVGGAGSGEGYTLESHEARRVLAIAVEELRGKVPVRAMGVEPRTPHEMVRFAEMVAESGIDAMQIYSLDVGHLGVPSADEIETYLTSVLSAGTVPAVISTHFSVGYLVPVDVLLRVATRFDHVIGVNCSTADVGYLVTLAEALPPHVELHTGFMNQALLALSVGASGFLSTEGNIVPGWCVEVIDRFRADDLAGMTAAFGRLVRFSTQLFRPAAGITTVKAALEVLGLPGGVPRLPRARLEDPAARARVAEVVAAFDVNASV